MRIRARTLAGWTAMAVLLSGCILFPPLWFPDPMGPPVEVVVDNQTDEEWVLGWGADIPIGYAVPADEVGIVAPIGPDPTELVLLDRECGEVQRLDWDGSATGVRIVEPGTMSATDDVPGDTTFFLTEVWECTEDTFNAAPTPGEALPEAGGTIHLASPDGSSYTLNWHPRH